MYYANYLKFMERARTERLRTLGFEQDRLRDEQGVLFTVHSVNADFMRPAVFNDLLEVSAEIETCKRASLTFSQLVYRDGDSEPLCRGRVRIACVDAGRFRPCPIPDFILRELVHVS